MKLIYYILFLCAIFFAHSCQTTKLEATATNKDVNPVVQTGDKNKIIANPLNLNYRFQPDKPSRREAAYSVIEYFKWKYYLFASKSGGYRSSADLIKWTYIPATTILTIENYTPTVLALGDTLYYVSSCSTQICYTTNPVEDNWKVLSTSQFSISQTDPRFSKMMIREKCTLIWGVPIKN